MIRKLSGYKLWQDPQLLGQGMAYIWCSMNVYGIIFHFSYREPFQFVAFQNTAPNPKPPGYLFLFSFPHKCLQFFTVAYFFLYFPFLPFHSQYFLEATQIPHVPDFLTPLNLYPMMITIQLTNYFSFLLFDYIPEVYIGFVLF